MTNFNVVMNRYLFDERLRSFLLEAFSYIEISLRTNWAYHIAHVFRKGEFAHRNAALFDERHFKVNLGELERSYQRIRYQPAYNFQTLSIWELGRVDIFRHSREAYPRESGERESNGLCCRKTRIRSTFLDSGFRRNDGVKQGR